MRSFPIVCVDDFYSDPDSIRQWALTLDYEPCPVGTWPGKRSKTLHEVDPVFFDLFCHKLFSVYYDLEQANIQWRVKTQFQLIESFDNDPLSKKNTGWTHYDRPHVFGGLIYLTPGIDRNCGTSMYKQTHENNDFHAAMDAKCHFYKEGRDCNYDKKMTDHNSHFIETAEYKNIYNRMISFDGDTAHKANSFYTAVPRLTQVFFIEEMDSLTRPPLERHKRYL